MFVPVLEILQLPIDAGLSCPMATSFACNLGKASQGLWHRQVSRVGLSACQGCCLTLLLAGHPRAYLEPSSVLTNMSLLLPVSCSTGDLMNISGMFSQLNPSSQWMHLGNNARGAHMICSMYR
jgi:hypothetical protein